ncbi:LPS export ABC transporter permease LptF [Shimia abyssi]|uniref:LPS export ABC transporter permease LptF n=1 Tax=Shimia abyssi TaxID=1662395 RepID=UPI000D0DD46C|nr:LPS export ABC transporter permease LptF [Shimia abyssi]
MRRFDRYILSQLLTLFGFFALVLVSVYWVNRAVVLFDTLIASGQNVSVFFELTVLSLPNVIRIVLPVSVFAAAVYAINRLSSESELTVMQATGFSPWRLARPVFFFGMIVAVMMSILTHFLVPASLSELTSRQKEITENVTARLLTEGSFLHPTNGVTFYIREIAPDGVLRDVFLSDQRTDDHTTTYTAEEAYLVQDESGPKLVMVNGLAQVHTLTNDSLITTNFSDFSYDISALVDIDATQRLRLEHLSTYRLLFDSHSVAEELETKRGWVVYEGNARIAQALIVIVFPLVGFAMLLLGGFSRFGVWPQILIAFVLLVGLETMKGAVSDPVGDDPNMWPLTYLPALTGCVLVGLLLQLSARPIRFRRKAAS